MKSKNKHFKRDAELNKADMTTLVKKHFRGQGFKVHLSFSLFDWYLAEKFVAREINLEQLGDKHSLQLTLGIFPQNNSTLMHMIAA